MQRGLSVILGLVVAGVVLLAGVAVVLTLRADGDDTAEVTFEPFEVNFPPVDHDPDSARALIDAWTRWRTATFVVSGTWTRTLDDDPNPLVGEVYVAQQPPRRYSVRLGNVVDLDRDQATFEADVATELALVGGYVLGDTRLYDVATTDAGCFRAELIEPVAASPWGFWAEYCFDDGSGALASARVRRQTAVDVEEVTAIRTDVTDEDFAVR